MVAETVIEVTDIAHATTVKTRDAPIVTIEMTIGAVTGDAVDRTPTTLATGISATIVDTIVETMIATGSTTVTGRLSKVIDTVTETDFFLTTN